MHWLSISFYVKPFDSWPLWLKGIVYAHGVVAAFAAYLWWPKSDKGWRRLGYLAAYLLIFYLVMRYALHVF